MYSFSKTTNIGANKGEQEQQQVGHWDKFRYILQILPYMN